MSFNRRSFIKTTALAGSALALPAISYGRVLGSNDDIRLCVIGLNGRGQEHMDKFGDNVVALCDCDEKILGEQSQGKDVTTFVDFRKVLDDKNIDAVSIATPNHTHSLIGITAAMAGKHVYCEKPVSHNVWEGRQLASAAHRYNVLIQCGTQARSSKAYEEAHQFVTDGNLAPSNTPLGLASNPVKVLENWIGRCRFPNTLITNSGVVRQKNGNFIDQICITTGIGTLIPATATWVTRAFIRWTLPAGSWVTIRFPRAC